MMHIFGVAMAYLEVLGNATFVWTPHHNYIAHIGYGNGVCRLTRQASLAPGSQYSRTM